MRFAQRLTPLLLVCLTMVGCKQSDQTKPAPPRPVKSIVLQNPMSDVHRQFPGKVLPAKRADLSFEVAGKLVKLPIQKGQTVKQGQLLAQLDPKPFKDASQQTQARYNLAKSQFLRGKELIKGNYISHAEYDKLRSSYEVSSANLNTANRNLHDSTLYAPFNGIIANTYVENHEQVKAKQTLMALHDISELDIEVHVPEKFMLMLKGDAEKNTKPDITVTFDAYPTQHYPVTFKEFSSQADADTQTYAVVFKMPQPSGINVLPGMSVSVDAKITKDQFNTTEYYKLPVHAVFSLDDQQAYVWVVDSSTHTVHKQAIQTGALQGNSIEVTAGLKPGQRIVTAGVHNLRDNQAVKTK